MVNDYLDSIGAANILPINGRQANGFLQRARWGLGTGFVVRFVFEMRYWSLSRRQGTDSPNRKIFRAALVVGSATVATKFGATLKELVVAQWFGRSDDLDAFLVAFLLPTFILNVVVGALSASLVPSFVATREREGPEAAQRLFSSIMLISTLVLTVIAVLLALLAPLYLPFLGSSFSPTKLRLTRELLYIMLPFIFFNGIFACAAAVLNAGERFAAAALAPLATPLVTILLVEIGARRWGAFALAGGGLVGSVLEATIAVSALQSQQIRLAFKWHGLSPELRTALVQYTPMLAALFLASGTGVVDQSMAAMLQPGSVAALSYANKIVTVAMAIGVTALGTAALPYFSKMAAANDWDGCRHTLKRYSMLVIATTVPLTLALIVFAKFVVRLLFERGAFTSADTDLVSRVLICYAIQVPFAVGGNLLVRFLSAARRNGVLFCAAALSLSLDVVLNLVLMRIIGIAGIALSTSIVYMTSFGFLTIWSSRFLTRQRQSVATAVL